MNKQLINKYKPEFDHWLNGESILVKYVNENQAESDYKHWHEDNDVFESNLDYLIIINDEFVEFRKALTEGKIIQIYDVIEQHISNPSLDKFGWKDFKSFTASSPFSKTPDFYRIKPDEPKFKVGDWVENSKSSLRIIKQVTAAAEGCDTVTVGNKKVGINVMLITDLKLWKPKPGEWCWFYDKASNKYSHLAKFNEMWKNKFRSTTDTPWQFCEPFLNSLPSYLKDK